MLRKQELLRVKFWHAHERRHAFISPGLMLACLQPCVPAVAAMHHQCGACKQPHGNSLIHIHAAQGLPLPTPSLPLQLGLRCSHSAAIQSDTNTHAMLVVSSTCPCHAGGAALHSSTADLPLCCSQSTGIQPATNTHAVLVAYIQSDLDGLTNTMLVV